MGILSAHSPNPALYAPVGAYLTDGNQLLWIIESDSGGALGEDAASGQLVEIRPADLDPERAHFWKRIYPAKDPL